MQFARSATTDTRVAVGLGADVPRSGRDDALLRELQVGLYIPTEAGDVMEVAPAHDLAVNIALPEAASLPPKLQALLGPAYEQFERSNWREGFGDACQIVEDEAREYMVSGFDSGRISMVATKRSRS